MDDKKERERQQAALQAELDELLAHAKKRGFAISVRTEPLRPLAMGHYMLVGEVREWPAAQRNKA